MVYHIRSSHQKIPQKGVNHEYSCPQLIGTYLSRRSGGWPGRRLSLGGSEMFDYRQEMKLAPYVTWTQIEDRVYICGGTRETSFDIEESKPLIATLQWLRSRAGGAMWGEICQELSRNCKDNKLETVGPVSYTHLTLPTICSV